MALRQRLQVFSGRVAAVSSRLLAPWRWLFFHRSLFIGRPRNTIGVLLGFRAVDAGRLDDAGRKFQSALGVYQKDYRALIGMAAVHTQREQLDQGLFYWRQSAALLPSRMAPLSAIMDPNMEGAKCLLKMYRFSDARKLLEKALRNRLHQQPAYSMLAVSYMRERNFSEAIRLWSDYESQFPSAPAPVVGRVNCLIDSGDLIDAKRELEHACARWPGNTDLEFVSARLAFCTGSYEVSRKLLQAIIASRPEHIPAYALLRQVLKKLGQTGNLETIIITMPGTVRSSVEFIDEVLVPYFIDSHDMDRYRISQERIGDLPWSPRAAHIKARFLFRNLEFEKAVEMAESLVMRFPYYLNNYRILLQSYRQTNRSERLEALKLSMRSRFGENVLYPVLIELGVKYISTDLPEVLNWLIDNPYYRETFLSQLLDGVLQGDDAQTIAGILLKRDVELTPKEAIPALGIRCQSEDVALLKRSSSALVTWGDFERNCLAYRERLAMAVKLLSSSGECSRKIHEFYSEYLDTLGLYSSVNIFSRESYFEAVSAIQTIVSNISAGVPTSLIRLGDGEGNFLPYRQGMQEFVSLDQKKIQHTWWGQQMIEGSRLVEIRQHFREVIDNANIVGAPPPWRLIKENLAGPDFDLSEQYTRGNMAVIDLFVSGAISRDKDVVSSAVSNDWYRWNLYPAIFEVTRYVSYISCHDLQEYLVGNYGLAARQRFLIPAEHAYRQMFSESRDTIAPDNKLEELRTKIFPETFDEISDRIDPVPGEVYLVAAGFLGKFFCDIVKRRGGIGIDIGSTADYWMGHQTRRYDRSGFSFNPVDNQVQGMPIKNLVSRV